jgi:NADH dehydrogenase FAD-containing subunit
MTTNLEPAPPRVVVAGGGVAGMEAVLALRELAGERVARYLAAHERFRVAAAG